MKVTVEIDCTPTEARQFLGLPNVEPIQAAVMDKLEEKMLKEMERFSPDALMKNWMSLIPQNAERLQEMFLNLTMQGLGRSAGETRRSE